ncbi:dihydropyrimidine dehydrogenase subunit A [Variibacter gotjawalensis]|uniref:Dihydropyrimidine dehydrogenase subunit A n=1 Tax=Variibacter gotjawalensis TaxID=1333996 RepID=A0A0S3PZK2_9BRAD|nr:TIGR03862 family flavoprotein [Variibacter gotjawalensis]NIK47210.1 hypothetical protein [Variibacter gotjawalensis]RZS49110.1 hypothetical protein EV661_1535 [Variibacter gotjawalensis]BAT61372.1 dihydropyrimidine dehydrogenase subunit A [Variibacter gotjawalensis]
MTQSAAIVGAGPAGLMAADVLSSRGVKVTIYERMPSAGRKFLMAGRGGLNLTHGEAFDRFLARYREAAPHLVAALEAFSPQALRDFADALGEPTFVGSSGRVFPKSFKASPLLRAWLRRLDAQGVTIAYRHHWRGWNGDALVFDTPDGKREIAADLVVLACGGASWPRLGSDGDWREPLSREGVAVEPLVATNCGVRITWSETMRAFAGTPLKRIALTCGAETVRGEAIVTASGLEGGAVYALSAPIRKAIAAEGRASLLLALRPDMDAAQIAAKLAKPRGKQSISSHLRKTLNLSPVAVSLLHEAALARGEKLAALSAEKIAELVNALPLPVTGMASLDRAISTAGGVKFSEIDASYMLSARSGTFVAGEMLDWEAPTGGYLLQACFATGHAAGRGAAAWLDR